MSKPKRNQVCPCGSGKKHKHCCGSSQIGEMAQSTNSGLDTEKPILSRAEIAMEGLPGNRCYQYFVPEKHVLVQRLGKQDPELREYKVVLTLSRPGFPLRTEYHHSMAEFLEGDSHLAISLPSKDPAKATTISITFDIESQTLRFVGLPNSEGYLGKLVIDLVKARDFDEAETVAYMVVAWVLSHYSLCLDLPLFVCQVDVTDLRQGTRRVSVTNPYIPTPLTSVPQMTTNIEFQGYASLYREALNSNSPVYQFLCFYKIIEAIQKRQDRIAVEGKSIGRQPSRPTLVIPKTVEDQAALLKDIFPTGPNAYARVLDSIFIEESLGKKVNAIINKHLQPLRLAVAHALFSQTGELTLSIDEAFHLQRLLRWLPLTKCIVRWLLMTEFVEEFKTNPKSSESHSL